ncbi:MAG: GNAT family N-acetyltransferase [Candidatus Thermoplasmatota archaeon]|nr:GNAT family N-acetyltransferase [Candidatus Thermoplasmatota archaeon]
MSLEWTKCSPICNWSKSKLIEAYDLILDTTGESYSPERLRMLPLSEKIGSWILQDEKSNLLGLLWVMELSNDSCRVLAFSVAKKFQRKGFGSKGWKLFSNSAKKNGFKTIQLEVRSDNAISIAMYRRRGLNPVGMISGYYGGQDGWLMLGNIR